MSSAQDRRQAPRISITQLVQMQFGKERWVEATALDVSETGFRCQATSEINPGDQIYILVDLDGTSISADAIAVHVEQVEDDLWEAGFRFVGWHGKSRSAVEAFVRAQEP